MHASEVLKGENEKGKDRPDGLHTGGGGSFLQKLLHDLVGLVEAKHMPPVLLDHPRTVLSAKDSGRGGAGALPGFLGEHRGWFGFWWV